MRKLILLLLIAVAACGGYRHFIEAKHLAIAPAAAAVVSPHSESTQLLPAASQRFSCDGRIYCSQMRSCEEAMYFLQNCPNTKMDGNGDGVPCERQWCG